MRGARCEREEAYKSVRRRARASATKQTTDMLLRSRARSSVVEQLAFNQLVVGSIPTGLTKWFSVVNSRHPTRRTGQMRGTRSEADEAYKSVRRGGRASVTKQMARHARRKRVPIV